MRTLREVENAGRDGRVGAGEERGRKGFARSCGHQPILRDRSQPDRKRGHQRRHLQADHDPEDESHAAPVHERRRRQGRRRGNCARYGELAVRDFPLLSLVVVAVSVLQMEIRCALPPPPAVVFTGMGPLRASIKHQIRRDLHK